MSRIGKLPITLPKGVEVKIDGNKVHVKGPKGELEETFSPIIEIKMEDGTITVTLLTTNHRFVLSMAQPVPC